MFYILDNFTYYRSYITVVMIVLILIFILYANLVFLSSLLASSFEYSTLNLLLFYPFSNFVVYFLINLSYQIFFQVLMKTQSFWLSPFYILFQILLLFILYFLDLIIFPICYFLLYSPFTALIIFDFLFIYTFIFSILYSFTFSISIR